MAAKPSKTTAHQKARKMANFTPTLNGSILEQTYNLTSLTNETIVTDPTAWAANFNTQMGGIAFVTILYVFAFILFMAARKNPATKDSEALLFAGFLTSLIGALAFVIDITAVPNAKIISWPALLPIIIITAIAIILNYINRNY